MGIWNQWILTIYVICVVLVPSHLVDGRWHKGSRDQDLFDDDDFFARNGQSEAFSGTSNLFNQPFNSFSTFGQSPSENPFSTFSFKPSFSFSPSPSASSFSSSSSNFGPSPSGSFSDNLNFGNFGPSFQPIQTAKKQFRPINTADFSFPSFFSVSNVQPKQSPATVFSISAPQRFSNFQMPTMAPPASFSAQFPAQVWDFNQLSDLFSHNTAAWNLPQNFVQDKLNEAFKKSTTQFGTFPSQGSFATNFPAVKFGSSGSLSNMFSATKPENLDIAKNAFTLEDFSKSLSKQ